MTSHSPSTTAWQAMRSSGEKPWAVLKRSSTDVGALRFPAPARIRTRQRPQTPMAPQEFASGTEALRAASSTVSFSRARADFPRGVNVTMRDEAFTGMSHLETKLSSSATVYYSMRHESMEVGTMKPGIDENRLAEEIVSVLPASVLRTCSSDRSTIRYAVRGEGMKLRTIVLNRMSLRKLGADPARDVKVEYLQRDLVECAARRSEFRYPRLRLRPSPAKHPWLGMPMASMF